MLPSEIAPFADHHMDKLNTARTDLMQNMFDHPEDPAITIPREDVIALAEDLRLARHALNRFKMCMIDETKMKEKAEAALRQRRLADRKK